LSDAKISLRIPVSRNPWADLQERLEIFSLQKELFEV